MRIIYIFLSRHYYLYDDEQFGINYLREKGHDVEVWSAVNWTYERKITTPKNIHDGHLIYIENEEELNKRLDCLNSEKVHFILYAYHTYQKSDYIIRRILKYRGFEFSNLSESANLIEIRQHKSLSLYFAIKGIKEFAVMVMAILLARIPFIPQKYHKKIEKKIIRFWGPVLYKSKFNFMRGNNAFNYIPNSLEFFSRRNVLIPHTDYYNYLRVKKQIDKKRIAVFIDEYEIGHSDFEKSGIASPISDSKKYYSELNSFFDRIEKELGLEVIIAAHPKAEYKGNEFNGRKIEYFKTAQLIGDCELVLYMYGTSFTYILLFKKNYIVFNTSQHLCGHIIDKDILGVRKVIKPIAIDISMLRSEIRLEKYINVYDSKINRLYEYYIKPKGTIENPYEIIEKHIV